jgi:hypothetical protein
MEHESLCMNFVGRSRTLKVVTIVEILSSFFGFWGGIPLIIDPNGSILGLDTELIQGIPINNYLLPGIWLFVVYGCGCGFAAYGLWNFKTWGWKLAVIISIIWIGWVLSELVMWRLLVVKNSTQVLNTTWPWLIPPVLALLLLSRPELRNMRLKKG